MIRDVKIARKITLHIPGPVMPGLDRRPTVAAVTPGVLAAYAGHRGYNAICVHLSDAVIPGISQIHVAGTVHIHAQNRVEAGLGRRDPIPAVVDKAVLITCENGNNTAGIHFADHAVAIVSNVDVSGSIHLNIIRITQTGLQSRTCGDRIGALSGAGHGCDDPLWIDLANPVVVHYVDASTGIYGHPGGQVQSGLGGRAAVAAEARLTRPGNGGDDPFAVHLAHTVVEVISKIKVPLSIHGGASWTVDFCRGG